MQLMLWRDRHFSAFHYFYFNIITYFTIIARLKISLCINYIQGGVAHICTVGRSATAGKPKVNSQFEGKSIVKPLHFFDLLYTEKLSRGKTFAVLHKTHHSLEKFRGASGPCHYVLYTANDSRGKLSRLAKKPRKFSPSKVLPYTVYSKIELVKGQAKFSHKTHRSMIDAMLQ